MALQCGAVSGWSSYFSTAGESCWLNLFDIQLVRYTGKVIYPAVRTTASTHRLNDSTPHDNPRSSELGHPPFALIAAQPSAPAPIRAKGGLTSGTLADTVGVRVGMVKSKVGISFKRLQLFFFIVM